MESLAKRDEEELSEKVGEAVIYPGSHVEMTGMVFTRLLCPILCGSCCSLNSSRLSAIDRSTTRYYIITPLKYCLI